MSLSRYVRDFIPKDYFICGVSLKPFCIGHYLILKRFESPFVRDEEETRTTRNAVTDENFMSHFFFALFVCSHDFESFMELKGNVDLFSSERQRLNAGISKYVHTHDGMNPLYRLNVRCENWFCDRWKKRPLLTVIKQCPTFTFIALHANHWIQKLLRRFNSESVFDIREHFASFREYLKDGFQVPVWKLNNVSEGDKASNSKHWSYQLVEDLTAKGNRNRTEVLNMHLADAWNAWAHIAEDAGAITLISEEDAEKIEQAKQTGESGLEIDAEGWEKLMKAYNERLQL